MRRKNITIEKVMFYLMLLFFAGVLAMVISSNKSCMERGGVSTKAGCLSPDAFAPELLEGE